MAKKGKKTNGILSEMCMSFAKLEGAISTRLDSLIEEVRGLKEADQTLHKRISEKDTKIDSNTSRIDVLETKSTTNRWWIATIAIVVTAAATFILIFK